MHQKHPTLPFSLPLAFWASLLFVCLHTHAGAQSILSRSVHFSIQNAAIPQALAQLSQESGVEIAFSERFFKNAASVTLRLQGETLRAVLTKILAGSGTAFREVDGQIVIFLPEKQRQFTLGGYVEDAETGERLIAATVWCPKIERGTVTNEYGFFSLSLPEGESDIRVSYIGYAEEKRQIELSENRLLKINLQPSVTLAEVVVTPHNFPAGSLLPSGGGGHQLAGLHLQAAPTLGGMNDLMRMSYLLPGVQTGADGVGGMHVRGGDTDQNLLLLDGAPVYNHEHLLGLFSVYNTSAIRSAKLLKGFFPARYGGRVSSVLDVRTREGNQKVWSAEGGLDLLSARATLEGPLVKDKGAVLLSFRRTHSDAYLKSHINRAFFPEEEEGENIKFSTKYWFYDFNAKLNYQFTPKDRVFLSFYKGSDLFSAKLQLEEEVNDSSRYSDNAEFTFKWGNTLTALRWNHLFGKQLFCNTTLTYSQYRHLFGVFSNSYYEDEFGKSNDYFFFEFSSDIRDQAAKIDFEYAPGTAHYVRFGGGYTLHKIQPGFFTTFEESSADSFGIQDFLGQFKGIDSIGHEWEAYLEDEFSPGERWHLNLGLRWSGFRSAGGANYAFPEPRLHIRRDLGKNLSVYSSFSRMAQYLHRTTSINDFLGFQVWTPSTAQRRPLVGWQGTMGVEAALPHGLQLSVEGYLKKVNNLYTIQFSDSIVFEGDVITLDDLIQTGSSRSYGVEVLLERTQGRTGGWLSYAYAHTKHDFSSAEIESPFNRRHEFKLLLHRKFGEHWQASLSGVFSSRAMPLLEDEAGTFLFSGGSTLLPSGVQLDTKPNHRADLSVTYSQQTGKFQHRLQGSIYNLYNRKNTAFYRPVEKESGEVSYQPVHLLPMMVGVSYEVRF